MSRISFYLLLAAAIGISLAGDFVYGRLSSRAAQARQLAEAAERIAGIPRRLGPWQAKSDFPIDASAVNMLQCSGYINRTYVHDESGEAVTLTVLAGPTGPTIAHTPEICFSSREYDVVERAASVELGRPGRPGPAGDSLLRITFRARTVSAERLRVYYGWHRSSGGWQAPKNQRLALANAPFLYKIHVGVEVPLYADNAGSNDGQDAGRDGNDPVPTDPARRFLAEALPTLNRHLFGSSVRNGLRLTTGDTPEQLSPE